MREWITNIGVENMGKRLINSKEGKVEFDKPSMPLATLMKVGGLFGSGSGLRRIGALDAHRRWPVPSVCATQ